jgi:threonine/homoserine/homoserine lactone efflux protein
MTIESSAAFVAAMLLFVASPGPGMMGCVAVAVRQNVRNSAAFISGMIIGDLVYLLFAVFGLTALARNFGEVFYAVRVLGGLYLLYLAYKLWTAKAKMSEGRVDRRRGNFFAGLFITLSNPKVIMFYCGFLPNFVDLQSLTFSDVLVVSLLVTFVIVAVMGGYTYIAMKTGGVVSAGSGKMLNRGAGAALAVTGAFMIFRR